MKKILTISVAAYNAARDLPKCLDSITACLNIDKIEIFIVDDGSTDATRDVALKYCIQFPQSVFLISKKNGAMAQQLMRLSRSHLLPFLRL